MAKIKTVITHKDIQKYIDELENPQIKEDTSKVIKIYKKATGEKPKHYVGGMIGFGVYHYKSEKSSQEGDWPLAAFASRKSSITFYMLKNLIEDKESQKKLGKFKLSGGCLHIKKLSDVDINILEKIIKKSYDEMKKVNKS